MSTSTSNLRVLCFLLSISVLLSIAVVMQAAPIGVHTFHVNPDTSDETGYKIESQWDLSGIPTAVWSDGKPSEQGAVPEGFKLLDGTLKIETPIPDGQMKLRVRMQFDARELRAISGRRISRVRLLRLRRVGRRTRWMPIRKRMLAREIRARRKIGPATFELGEYGVDWTDSYVWGVLDVPGTFAIGVPEPISLLCMVGGAGVLMMRRSRRRACK